MSESEMNPDELFGEGGLNDQVDPELMMGALGIDREEIGYRKDFIGFDEDDEERLENLEPVFREHSEEIAQRFYDNLTGYDEAIEVFSRSPKKINELKKTQEAYLVSLATGNYDADYFLTRGRIGLLHYELDMPMKYYMGQYGVYYSLVFDILNDRIQTQVVDAVQDWAAQQDGGGGGFLSRGSGDVEMTDELEETIRTTIDNGMMHTLSVLRALNLDMQVATDAYMFASTRDDNGGSAGADETDGQSSDEDDSGPAALDW